MIVVIDSNEEVSGMPVVDVKSLLYNEDTVPQAINTKEEFEILNSLFQGTHQHDAKFTENLLRVAKILDMF